MKLAAVAKAAVIGAVAAQVPRLVKRAKAEGTKVLRKGIDRLEAETEKRRAK